MDVILLAIGMVVAGLAVFWALVYCLGIAATHFLGEDQKHYELVLTNGLLVVCALIVIGLMVIMFTGLVIPLAESILR